MAFIKLKTKRVSVLIKGGIFGIIFIAILCFISPYFVPRWGAFEGGVVHDSEDFYNITPNTVDYFTLGPSHSYFGINPMMIYAKTGYTGYNLGTSAQELDVSYYWLREACKYQTPQYVFLDVAGLFYEKGTNAETTMIKALTNMRPSLLKCEAAYQIMDSKEAILGTLFPLYQFHTNWNGLENENFQESYDQSFLKGAYLHVQPQPVLVNQDIDLYGVNEIILEGDNLEYRTKGSNITVDIETKFSELYYFCEANNIELIPVVIPTKKWTAQRNRMVQAFLARYDLELMDIYTGQEVGIDWERDSSDGGYHLSYTGAAKTSEYIAQYLVNKGTLADHRNDERYIQWNEDLLSYQYWEQFSLMKKNIDTFNYLEVLIQEKDQYYIIVAGSEDVCSGWNPELQTMVNRLGLKEDYYDNKQKAFVAVINGGTVEYEAFGIKGISLKSDVLFSEQNSLSIEVSSFGGITYGSCSIAINDVERAVGTRGLNLVILDKNTGELVSSVAIDTHLSESPISYNGIQKNDILNRIYASQVLNEGTYHLLSDLSLELRFFGNGMYFLKKPGEELYLTVEKGGNTAGTNVVFQPYTGVSTQQWYFTGNPDGTYTINSLYNNLVLDHTGNGIVMQEKDYGLNQCFQMEPESVN